MSDQGNRVIDGSSATSSVKVSYLPTKKPLIELHFEPFHEAQKKTSAMYGYELVSKNVIYTMQALRAS